MVYFVLVVSYSQYLKQFDASVFEVDKITYFVSEVSSSIISHTGLESHIEPHQLEQSCLLYVNNKPVVRVIEGCNAMSVIVLFIAFVIAFSGPAIKTIWFVFFGGLFIFLLNIIRIVLISIALFYFPQYEPILHEVIFPLLIYGVVFLLWIIWVNKFSYHAKDDK